ncbi:MAG TPA: hypothetical protein VLE97_07915 [Gaiellaceae bacterium]|nr:hypothetical protein [Gaiellaceae bacterium]
MTPLEHAAAILVSLADVAGVGGLPDTQVVGVGDAVIACAEARVTLATVMLEPNLLNAWACDVAETATYLVSIARECAWTANDDGTENYPKLAEVVGIVDADVAALTALFKSFHVGEADVTGGAVGWGATRAGTIAVTTSGGLIVSTLTLTVGVP